jgi:hypothetical protein
LTADWQIGRRTGVITMDTPGGLLAGWADRLWADGTCHNDQSGLLAGDLLNFKTG